METPPRAWGRHGKRIAVLSADGNTPTGVGKTSFSNSFTKVTWKHPHGRGEDFTKLSRDNGERETPPRAWGRLHGTANASCLVRNTPTGVGKTNTGIFRAIVLEKHPHGRGEDNEYMSEFMAKPETPPRAWGRLCARVSRFANIGNTPTGVGKTASVVWYDGSD